MIKTKPRYITLTRAEGPTAECGKPQTVTSFGAANGVLGQWSRTVETGGSHKCDFAIEFADGQFYRGRVELTREFEPLDRHCIRHLEFYAGRRRPDHMTAEQYQAFLSGFGDASGMAHHFLELYEFADN